MNSEMNAEYSSLRDEIMKWQDRRIVFSQVSITLVLAYIAYLISKDVIENSKAKLLSWQILSALPLLVLTLAMHITRMFEQYMLRAGSYISVFFKSTWEEHVAEILPPRGWLNWGYNKSMAAINYLIACSSIFILYEHYQEPATLLQWILFFLCLSLFLIVFIRLFMFSTEEETKAMIEKWKKIERKIQSNNA